MPDRPDPFSDIEQFFDEFVQLETPLSDDPPVDIVETDDAILVFVDLPGRDADSIEVTLEESRQLTIEADREIDDVDGEYVMQERRDNSVRRRVRLPTAVDDEKTEASYDSGVLEITLPKLTAESDGTEIPVN